MELTPEAVRTVSGSVIFSVVFFTLIGRYNILVINSDLFFDLLTANNNNRCT